MPLTNLLGDLKGIMLPFKYNITIKISYPEGKINTDYAENHYQEKKKKRRILEEYEKRCSN